VKDRIDWKIAWQVAVTYIGTVVGAGFASGQEILQFFSRFGDRALLGIAVATALFFFCGDFMMRLGRNRQVNTFGEVAISLFGVRVGRIIQSAMLLMLFGVTVAMLAGSGALLAEQAGMPFALGALLCAVLTMVTLLGGMRGLMSANAIIVPLMLGFIVWAFFYGLFVGHFAILQTSMPLHAMHTPSLWGWLISAVLYVGFNMGLSVTVMIPLGRVPKSRATLALGALLGALGLGIMLFMLHILLVSFFPQIASYEVPIGQLVTRLSQSVAGGVFAGLLRYGFVIVLWGEIFSTLLSNVYGLASELQGRFIKRRMANITIILTLAFIVCQIGFAHIITYVYPIFGYAGFVLIMALLIRDHHSF